MHRISTMKRLPLDIKFFPPLKSWNVNRASKFRITSDDERIILLTISRGKQIVEQSLILLYQLFPEFLEIVNELNDNNIM